MAGAAASARGVAVRDRRHQDVRRPARGRAAVARSAASGCSSRRSRTRCSTARSTWPCTAARTCRRCCPTAWRSAPCCRARTRATRWCCRTATAAGDAAPMTSSRSARPAPRIGTSSVRRTAQLTRALSRARDSCPIRGNLDTRLRKLDAGEFDALVLAAAGLHGSDTSERISAALPPRCVRAGPGPGHHRGGSAQTMTRRRASVVEPINDPAAAAALAAERAVVARSAAGARCRSAPTPPCRTSDARR